jgi:hypothetical protein
MAPLEALGAVAVGLLDARVVLAPAAAEPSPTAPRPDPEGKIHRVDPKFAS